ncbi:hypothetical protein CYMTET_31147, partial [Cymbomonas tetramitiformis]
ACVLGHEAVAAELLRSGIPIPTRRQAFLLQTACGDLVHTAVHVRQLQAVLDSGSFPALGSAGSEAQSTGARSALPGQAGGASEEGTLYALEMRNEKRQLEEVILRLKKGAPETRRTGGRAWEARLRLLGAGEMMEQARARLKAIRAAAVAAAVRSRAVGRREEATARAIAAVRAQWEAHAAEERRATISALEQIEVTVEKRVAQVRAEGAAAAAAARLESEARLRALEMELAEALQRAEAQVALVSADTVEEARAVAAAAEEEAREAAKAARRAQRSEEERVAECKRVGRVLYDPEEPLGADGESQVFAGYYEMTTRAQSRRPAAVKRLLLPAGERSAQLVEQAERELEMRAELGSCREIVQVLGYEVTPQSVLIALELCSGGSLRQYLEKGGTGVGVGWPARLRLARGAAIAVRELHARRHVHTGLGPDSMLVAGSGRLKLQDIGPGRSDLGTWLASDQPKGGLVEVAPELHEGGITDCTTASDVWALGCVIFFILTGEVSPFAPSGVRLSRPAVRALIAAGELDLSALQASPALEGGDAPPQSPATALPGHTSEGAVDLPAATQAAAAHLLRQMLTPDPPQRPSASQVAQHPLWWSPARSMEELLGLVARLKVRQGQAALIALLTVRQGQAALIALLKLRQGQAALIALLKLRQGQAALTALPKVRQGQAALIALPKLRQGQAALIALPRVRQGQAALIALLKVRRGQAALIALLK